MVHYLLGNVTTYPNLKLSLWNEKVYFNQTHLGKVRLHGELALRIQDWIDFDPINGTLVDNNIIEMGWCFRNSTTARYDGMKATFLYNLTQINDPTQDGYSHSFILQDLFGPKLKGKKDDPKKDDPSPGDLIIDTNKSDWEIVPYQSKKVCIKPGQCAFIVRFIRLFETADKNGQDIKIIPGQNTTYTSYGFYGEYVKGNFLLSSNDIMPNRYAVTAEDQTIFLEAQAPLPEVIYPKQRKSGTSTDSSLITLVAVKNATFSVVVTALGLVALITW